MAEAELGELVEGLTHVFDVWTAEPFGLKGARSWLVGAAENVIAGEKAKGEADYLEPGVRIAEERHAFHWPLTLPEVFMRASDQTEPSLVTERQEALLRSAAEQADFGDAASERRPGFDVVMGNPPWNEINVEELGFYALHDPGVRGLTSEAERQRRIASLLKRYPQLADEFESRRRVTAGYRLFFGPQGGYEQQGLGNLDLYELFTERYAALTRRGGWLGVVLPRTAFLGTGSVGFRRWLFGNATVHRLDFLLNNRSWAFPIHPQYTVALLSAERTSPTDDATMRTTGPSASLRAFESEAMSDGVPIAFEQLRGWTTGTKGTPSFEVPLLPSAASAEVFAKLRTGPRFESGFAKRWSALPIQGDFNETTDKRLFRHRDGVPVWKGRSFDRYDPHGAEPAGYAREDEAMAKLQAKRVSARSAFKGRFPAEVLAHSRTRPFYSARVAFRDVTNRTNTRTVIACLVPPETFLTNSAPYLVFPEGEAIEQAFVVGVLNSLPFDWQARRFVETHLNFYVLDMLCLPPPERTDVAAVASRAARLSCVDERFEGFAKAAGVECGPLDDDERVKLRAEVDALAANAYGLTRADLDVIFSDFTQNAVPDSYRAAVRRLLDVDLQEART